MSLLVCLAAPAGWLYLQDALLPRIEEGMVHADVRLLHIQHLVSHQQLPAPVRPLDKAGIALPLGAAAWAGAFPPPAAAHENKRHESIGQLYPVAGCSHSLAPTSPQLHLRADSTRCHFCTHGIEAHVSSSPTTAGPLPQAQHKPAHPVIRQHSSCLMQLQTGSSLLMLSHYLSS